MNYGFVIDNRACIGCHACSTACKSENDVPLGVYRTWVKYVETGSGPDARRHFQVTRCNHCANPPCVRICPVTAMYQRHDGIVEFDGTVCIGCKACLQACPYDAIYIDPESGTAAKCHYCSHRTELGLEPACVVVCPTHAIIAGDMDDPRSEIARSLARGKLSVRRPEQGTAPKLYYVEGTDAALHPTAVGRAPEAFLSAEVLDGGRRAAGSRPAGTARPEAPAGQGPARAESRSGTPLRAPAPQGLPDGGALTTGGRTAGGLIRVTYNAQHKVPWHWPVAAYLVTKGLGSGLFGLLALGWLLHLFRFDALLAVVGGLTSLVFLGATAGLLVYDLERPERFLRVLARPQWRSWLTRGAFLLLGFTAAAAAWWLLETAAYLGWVGAPAAWQARPFLLGLGLPLAAGAAVYTAFLFGQAEGRDLWQSPLLPLHMALQAALLGASALLLLDLALHLSAALRHFARAGLGAFLVLDLAALLLGELGMPHATEAAARAAHAITSGRWSRQFWWGAVALGHAAPLLLLLAGGLLPAALAAACAIAGLCLYEHAFVLAPQEVPNS
jgi:Fe-S-cluster-containing dehydrogenase component/formate-dependent nitrite reductase membrane component NrfD